MLLSLKNCTKLLPKPCSIHYLYCELNTPKIWLDGLSLAMPYYSDLVIFASTALKSFSILLTAS